MEAHGPVWTRLGMAWTDTCCAARLLDWENKRHEMFPCYSLPVESLAR